jgi:hypothetical protein
MALKPDLPEARLWTTKRRPKVLTDYFRIADDAAGICRQVTSQAVVKLMTGDGLPWLTLHCPIFVDLALT